MKKYLPAVFLLLYSFHLSAQWQYLPGPNGGPVINLEKDGNTLYALTRTGIHRSDDEGYHWQWMPGSQGASNEIEQLVAENGIFYGLESPRKLMRSGDGGQTWQAVLKNPFPNQPLNESLTGVFAKGDTVLVSSRHTIYRSVDRGETWLFTSDFWGLYQSRVFSAGSDFFSWGSKRIYRSSDGGLSWDKIFSDDDNFAFVGAVGNQQFVLYGDMKRLVRSTDGFKTWEVIKVDSLRRAFGTSNYFLKMVQLGDTLYCIAKTNYSDCYSRFCYSTDDGTTWHIGNYGKVLSIAIDDVISFDDQLVFTNHPKGINHSTDGCKTFTTEQAGLTATYIDAIDTQGRNVFLTGSQTVYYSKNNGIDWEETTPDIELSDCKNNYWLRATRKRLYLIEEYIPKYYSEDDGISWNPLQSISFFPVEATQNCIWGYSEQGLNRISDDGSTAFVNLEHLLDTSKIISLVTTANMLIVGINTGSYLMVNEAGKLWNKVPGISCTPVVFNTPEQLHFDGHNLFYFCGQDTYVFSEGATEWQLIYPQDWTTGIPFYHSHMTAIATHQGVTFVALDGKGIFYTTDATGRFYPLYPPLPDLHPTYISFRDHSIWVSMECGGIYTLELPIVQSAASEKPVFQCSPNPSDGHLQLRADVFFTDEIHLDILDMAGKLAVSTTLHPGQNWELDDPTLSKGMYIIMLRTPLGVSALKWSVLRE